MAETWWTESQAAQYLAANYPCEDRPGTLRMIERMIEEGTLPARYRRPDGTTVPIAHREWIRRQPPPGIDAADWNSSIEWSGHQREQEREDALGKYGLIEVQAAPLRAMCAPEPPMAAPARMRGDGRPPREIVPRLLVLAGMWIDEHGVPVAGSGEQAALERFLADQAAGQIQSESRIREIATQAISFAAAYRKAGN